MPRIWWDLRMDTKLDNQRNSLTLIPTIHIKLYQVSVSFTFFYESSACIYWFVPSKSCPPKDKQCIQISVEPLRLIGILT